MSNAEARDARGSQTDVRLFEKYGNYVRVAGEMGRSPSTIGRYIRGGKDAPQMLKHVEKQVIGK